MSSHFLHIGKTGGCSVKTALRRFEASHDLVLHHHPHRLEDVAVGEKVFFSVRHPVDRFVSGFNSRLRKAQPRSFREWSADEKTAFERFPTPNDLAEALSTWNPGKRVAARRAMDAIKHVRKPLAEWIGSVETLEARADDILLVLAQTSLDDDFEQLKRLLGLPPSLRLTEDEVIAHKTPEGFDTSLSPLGRKNLEAWFAADIALFEACLRVRERQVAARRVEAA